MLDRRVVHRRVQPWKTAEPDRLREIPGPDQLRFSGGAVGARHAAPRRILLRMCSNLHQIYLHVKLAEETARLQRYIVALAK